MADKDINQATLPTKALLGEDVNDVKTEVSEEKSPRIIPRNLKNTGSRCCVVGCKNRRGLDKIQNISRSYYRFPKDNKLAKMWIAALNRAHWKPTAWDRVCSDHFPHGIRTYTPGTVGYVPSIFPTKAIPTPRSTNNSSKASYSVQLNHLEKPSSSSCTTKTSSPITESNAVWECEHDYIQTKEDPESSPLHTELQKIIMELEMEVSFLKKKVLTLDAIKDDDKEFQFWTNMPNYSVFEAVSSYLKHRCGGRLVYWNGARTVKHKHFSTCMAKKPGRERTLTFEDEFFMTLVKLKTGKLHKDLAFTFGIKESYVSKVLTTWLNFLCIEMKNLFEMKINVDDQLDCFTKYPGLLIILDCTELIIERSSNLQARKEMYSNYKSRNTVKFLVGLSPNFTCNFVSLAYGGRSSDNYVTIDSYDLLNELKNNASCFKSVMADRGFTLNKELSDLGVELLIPHFKGRDRSQMSPKEVNESAEISAVRIHVERLIQRIRSFHIWDSTVKLSQKDIITQCFTACAYLVNFQMSIKQ